MASISYACRYHRLHQTPARQNPLKLEDVRDRQSTETLNNGDNGENLNTYMYMANIDNLVQAKAQSGSLSADIHAQAYNYQWL